MQHWKVTRTSTRFPFPVSHSRWMFFTDTKRLMASGVTFLALVLITLLFMWEDVRRSVQIEDERCDRLWFRLMIVPFSVRQITPRSEWIVCVHTFLTVSSVANCVLQLQIHILSWDLSAPKTRSLCGVGALHCSVQHATRYTIHHTDIAFIICCPLPLPSPNVWFDLLARKLFSHFWPLL